MIRCATAAALLLLTACLAHAEATLSGLNLGTHVTGPSVTTGDLQGRIVLFEYWGVHCPPCLASIAHLAEMQKRYGRDNFIIVANHCQGEPAPLVLSTWLSKGGGADVSVIMDGQLSGANVSGIPRCFLFNHEGKLVYDGSPFEVEDKVAAAVKASPGALVAGHDFHKLGREAAAIGAMNQPLGPVLHALRKSATSTDADTKAEADWLITKLTSYTDEALTRITADKSADPVAAMTRLTSMAGLFKGDELGKPFADLIKEWRADKSFQTELKAADLLAQIQEQAAKIGLGSDPEAKRRTEACQEILANLQFVQKKFPTTVAAHTAQQLMSTWSL